MEKKIPKIKLIIGLGNPGAAYKNTYHNAGKLFVDFLSGAMGLKGECFRRHRKGLFEICRSEKGPILIKPLNYMNENGDAASAALKASGAKTANMLVVHDDSDIMLGDYKISSGSGSAGHHGVQSVIERAGTKNFLRLRIGIRPEASNGKKAGDMVLKKITASDKKVLDSVFPAAAEEILDVT